MLISIDEARTINTDSRLAFTLALVAGMLNTAAFEIVGFFSANMTGNVSSLSDNLAKANLSNGMLFLAVILLFITGAAFSTGIINSGRRRGIRTIFAINIFFEAIALLLLGIIEIWYPPAYPGLVLVFSLSFLMGLQNAVVTRISNARVRTTHVSGTATDIGIEIAMLFDVLRRKESVKDTLLYLQRLELHTSTLVAFFLGGVIGIWLSQLTDYIFLIISGGGLLCLSLVTMMKDHLHH